MSEAGQKFVSPEPNQPIEKPVLLDAIDLTLRAIERRRRLYRNLVLCVTTVSLASVLSAALLRQWMALSGFIFLVPLTGGFLMLDNRLFRRWRSEILEMARLRGLDVAMFIKTILTFRQLPPHSLQAMLAGLPASSQVSRQENSTLQSAQLDSFEVLARKNARRILLGTALLTLALACLVGGAFLGSVTLLLLGALLLALTAASARR